MVRKVSRRNNRRSARRRNKRTARTTNRRTARTTNRRSSKRSNKRSARTTNRRSARTTNRRSARRTNRRSARRTNRRSAIRTNRRSSRRNMVGGGPALLEPRSWISSRYHGLGAREPDDKATDENEMAAAEKALADRKAEFIENWPEFIEKKKAEFIEKKKAEANAEDPDADFDVANAETEFDVANAETEFDVANAGKFDAANAETEWEELLDKSGLRNDNINIWDHWNATPWEVFDRPGENEWQNSLQKYFEWERVFIMYGHEKALWVAKNMFKEKLNLDKEKLKLYKEKLIENLEKLNLEKLNLENKQSGDGFMNNRSNKKKAAALKAQADKKMDAADEKMAAADSNISPETDYNEAAKMYAQAFSLYPADMGAVCSLKKLEELAENSKKLAEIDGKLAEIDEKLIQLDTGNEPYLIERYKSMKKVRDNYSTYAVFLNRALLRNINPYMEREVYRLGVYYLPTHPSHLNDIVLFLGEKMLTEYNKKTDNQTKTPSDEDDTKLENFFQKQVEELDQNTAALLKEMEKQNKQMLNKEEEYKNEYNIEDSNKGFNMDYIVKAETFINQVREVKERLDKLKTVDTYLEDYYIKKVENFLKPADEVKGRLELSPEDTDLVNTDEVRVATEATTEAAPVAAAEAPTESTESTEATP